MKQLLFETRCKLQLGGGNKTLLGCKNELRVRGFIPAPTYATKMVCVVERMLLQKWDALYEEWIGSGVCSKHRVKGWSSSIPCLHLWKACVQAEHQDRSYLCVPSAVCTLHPHITTTCSKEPGRTISVVYQQQVQLSKITASLSGVYINCYHYWQNLVML